VCDYEQHFCLATNVKQMATDIFKAINRQKLTHLVSHSVGLSAKNGGNTDIQHTSDVKCRPSKDAVDHCVYTAD